MKIQSIILFTIAGTLTSACAFAALDAVILNSQLSYNCTISNTEIGHIKLRMTLNEAKTTYPKARFERSSDGEGVPFVDINIGKDNLMSINAREDDPGKAINWQNKIVYISTSNPECHTVNGIYPGILVKDAEKILGEAKEIIVSEIESRKYIYFHKQPKNFTFLLDYPNRTKNLQSGTTKYPVGSIIQSIAVRE